MATSYSVSSEALPSLPAAGFHAIRDATTFGVENALLASVTDADALVASAASFCGASTFTWALFLAGAIANAIPGIILQLVLIPILVIAMEQAGLSLNRN